MCKVGVERKMNVVFLIRWEKGDFHFLQSKILDFLNFIVVIYNILELIKSYYQSIL